MGPTIMYKTPTKIEKGWRAGVRILPPLTPWIKFALSDSVKKFYYTQHNHI